MDLVPSLQRFADENRDEDALAMAEIRQAFEDRARIEGTVEFWWDRFSRSTLTNTTKARHRWVCASTPGKTTAAVLEDWVRTGSRAR